MRGGGGIAVKDQKYFVLVWLLCIREQHEQCDNIRLSRFKHDEKNEKPKPVCLRY